MNALRQFLAAAARLSLALRYARALGYSPRRAWVSARREG